MCRRLNLTTSGTESQVFSQWRWGLDSFSLVHCKRLPMLPIYRTGLTYRWCELRLEMSSSEVQLLSPECCNALSCSAAWLFFCLFVSFFFFSWLNNGVIFAVTFASCWENAYHPVGFTHACKASPAAWKGEVDALFLWKSPPCNLPDYLFLSVSHKEPEHSWQAFMAKGGTWRAQIKAKFCVSACSSVQSCFLCTWWRGALSLQETAASPRVAGKTLSL